MTALIAYFSRPGNNYVAGQIVNLPVGNTEVAAHIIQKLTGGDLFRIKTVAGYPADYNATTDVAKQELRRNARPKLSRRLEGVANYDVIFIGFPNWWNTMPMAVFTFLESHDFSGKTVVPFCTHEGSGIGHSDSDIKKLCPRAKLLDGIAIQGSSVQSSEDDIARWLQRLGLVD